MLNIKYETISYKNTKVSDKPNEDLVVYDENNSIGLLLDGVSRDIENGNYPNPSPAVLAAKAFSMKMMSASYKTCLKGLSKLEFLIEYANSEVRKYNKDLNHSFPAGVVGVCYTIDQNYFVYGYIGDCYAAIVRDGMLRTFTECQTKLVSQHKNKFTSDEIRSHICNNTSHPYGYGVWDGNPSAMDFTKYGQIRILPGDVVFIYSDGLENEVQKMDIDSLAHGSLVELFGSNSSANLDDRSCLRIKVCE